MYEGKNQKRKKITQIGTAAGAVLVKGYVGPKDRTKDRIKGCQLVNHFHGKKELNMCTLCLIIYHLLPLSLIIQKKKEMVEAK